MEASLRYPELGQFVAFFFFDVILTISNYLEAKLMKKLLIFLFSFGFCYIQAGDLGKRSAADMEQPAAKRQQLEKLIVSADGKEIGFNQIPHVIQCSKTIQGLLQGNPNPEDVRIPLEEFIAKTVMQLEHFFVLKEQDRLEPCIPEQQYVIKTEAEIFLASSPKDDIIPLLNLYYFLGVDDSALQKTLFELVKQLNLEQQLTSDQQEKYKAYIFGLVVGQAIPLLNAKKLTYKRNLSLDADQTYLSSHYQVSYDDQQDDLFVVNTKTGQKNQYKGLKNYVPLSITQPINMMAIAADGGFCVICTDKKAYVISFKSSDVHILSVVDFNDEPNRIIIAPNSSSALIQCHKKIGQNNRITEAKVVFLEQENIVRTKRVEVHPTCYQMLYNGHYTVEGCLNKKIRLHTDDDVVKELDFPFTEEVNLTMDDKGNYLVAVDDTRDFADAIIYTLNPFNPLFTRIGTDDDISSTGSLSQDGTFVALVKTVPDRLDLYTTETKEIINAPASLPNEAQEGAKPYVPNATEILDSRYIVISSSPGFFLSDSVQHETVTFFDMHSNQTYIWRVTDYKSLFTNDVPSCTDTLESIKTTRERYKGRNRMYPVNDIYQLYSVKDKKFLRDLSLTELYQLL